jgi:hypothetical protein
VGLEVQKCTADTTPGDHGVARVAVVSVRRRPVRRRKWLASVRMELITGWAQKVAKYGRICAQPVINAHRASSGHLES